MLNTREFCTVTSPYCICQCLYQTLYLPIDSSVRKIHCLCFAKPLIYIIFVEDMMRFSIAKMKIGFHLSLTHLSISFFSITI